MTYTFVPKQKCAKAYGRNLRISRKAAVKLCRVISKKPLKRAERLLDNLLGKKQSLRGKYHTNAAAEIKSLLESCRKNAEFLGMEAGRLFVHASAHQGTIMRRRRRKSAFGSRMKSTNIEVMLIEKGKKKDVIVVKDEKQMKKAIEDVAKKIAEKKAIKAEEKKHEENKEKQKAKNAEQNE